MNNGRSFTVLHTNDFHNKFSPEQADFIKQKRLSFGPDTILVDAGDAISAGNMGVRVGGEPILELMSETGYDVMCMGNREFHVADALLRHKIGAAKFPILCANIHYQKKQQMPLPLQPYTIKLLSNGIRVGIVGVTVPMVTSKMAARIVSSYLFDDPVETLSTLLPKVRHEADVIVALTHIGIKEDHRLAEACPEINLIIGGHTHVVLTEAKIVNTVPIVQAGWFGHYLGIVELSVSSTGVRLSSSRLEGLTKPGKKAA